MVFSASEPAPGCIGPWFKSQNSHKYFSKLASANIENPHQNYSVVLTFLGQAKKTIQNRIDLELAGYHYIELKINFNYSFNITATID